MKPHSIVKNPITIVTIVCLMLLQSLWASSIALGQKHSLVLSGNHIHGFGNDNFGQLGKSDAESVIGGQVSWVSVAAGGHHSIGLDRDLRVWSWGFNHHGQLGCGDQTARHQPTQVSQIEPIAKVAASLNNSFLLGVSGNVYGAGKASLLNKSSDQSSFTKVALPSKSVMVSASATFALSLDINGEVWVWGENSFYQRAGGVQVSKVNLPEKVKKVYCGGFHALALGASGNVYGWGKNDARQLGDLASIVHTPQEIEANVMDIRAGREHSLLLKSSHIVALGRNHVGQLGSQDRISSSFHQGDGQVDEFASGAYHSMSLNQEGKLTIWGDNAQGQLQSDGNKVIFPLQNSSFIVDTIKVGFDEVKQTSATHDLSLGIIGQGDQIQSSLIFSPNVSVTLSDSNTDTPRIAAGHPGRYLILVDVDSNGSTYSRLVQLFIEPSAYGTMTWGQNTWNQGVADSIDLRN